MEFFPHPFSKGPFPIRDDGTSARKTGPGGIVTMILCGAHAVESPQIMGPAVFYVALGRLNAGRTRSSVGGFVFVRKKRT